ncbi:MULTISPECIES: restriction endonuclease subunit S [unclassified Pseudomonas]|uniref:restriction endonuclease subunit S n=1 Tax=unclassified Pseudomonas TaxID=196821 RepID=UPI001304D8C4|nr:MULTISPECIES: restriction endonuclease subunit S [unclassified Pseudomonas]
MEWLGVVPEHWGVSPLKWLVELVTDKATTSNFQVGLENIEGWTGRFIETDTEFTGDGIAFRQEDILFGKLRPYLAKVWLAGKSGQAVGDFFVLRPCAVNSEFLHKYILTPTVIEDLNASTIGAKMPRVGWEDMAALAVTLPPHKEQTQIARFLDHETARIDALIEEQQRLIELLKEKRQAVISHAVTIGLDPTVPMKDSGVEWLGEVPAHWTINRLKQLVIDTAGIQMGPFGGMLVDLDDSDTGYKVYGQENTISGNFYSGNRWIPEHRYFALSNYHLEIGDIVLTRKGSLGNCRRVSLLPQAGIIDSDTIRVRVKNNMMNPDYLELLLHEAGYIATQLGLVKRGAILSGLNSEIIANLVIVVPPRVKQEELLQEIKAASSKYDQGISDCEYAIELFRERRSALISAAVTGKIDVRGWQPPASATSPELAKEAV